MIVLLASACRKGREHGKCSARKIVRGATNAGAAYKTVVGFEIADTIPTATFLNFPKIDVPLPFGVRDVPSPCVPGTPVIPMIVATDPGTTPVAVAFRAFALSRFF